MKEHFVAAAVRPFVQAARRVGGETDRAYGCVLIEAEKDAAGERGADGSSGAGGAMELDEFLIDQCAADGGPGFVTADGGADEVFPADRLAFGEREQRRVDDDAEMTHGAGVHVFADESMAEGCVGEGRVAGRYAEFRAHDVRGAVAAAARHLNCLAAPRKRSGFERAGKHVEQAGFYLVHDGDGKFIELQRPRCPRHAA